MPPINRSRTRKGAASFEVPKITVEVEYLGEDWEVEIICPKWAIHKKNGGDPPDAFEEEGGESMWELYVQDQGTKAAEKEFKKRKDKADAEEKAKNDARIASLKASFEVFDVDGSGELTEDEVLGILTRMTGGGTELTLEDAKAFIEEFDRDGDGCLDVYEFITAMGVVSDAHDDDGDGVADMKDGAGQYDGKEDEFAAKLAAGETLVVAGLEAGKINEGVDAARRLQS